MDKSTGQPRFMSKLNGWVDDYEKARIFSGMGPIKLHMQTYRYQHKAPGNPYDLYACKLEIKIIGETKV